MCLLTIVCKSLSVKGLASHPVDELTSPAKVTQVITVIDGISSKAKHTLDSVAIDTIDTIKGIDKGDIAHRLRDGLTENTKGGNN
ncbi:MAG: hypothetical protein CMM93_04745 [Rickettsiales bacterium]|nr:hypothetical protein [Rickettsiales bacterium]|tara:strand:+ start:1906 stop:2160 length:255 start_codon:yes stop_codon:yes gene_type:complete